MQSRGPLLVLALAFACGGSSGADRTALRANPSRPVPLGEWCDVLVSAVCERSGKCTDSKEVTAGCMDTGPGSCLAGREPKSESGHSAASLAKCLDTVEALSCEGFIANLAGHVECSVSANVLP